MTNKVLLIVGMQRSGTSLISHWLYKCGLHLGDKILGPGIGNTEGHFEDVDFLRLHEEILKDNLLPASGLVSDTVPKISFTLKKKLKKLIARKNNSNKEWGWKEPRTSLFLPVYHELLPDAHYLIIIRDYQSVVSSLVNRMYAEADKKYLSLDWFTAFWWKTVKKHFREKKLYKQYSEFYLRVWMNYNEEILQHLSKLPQNLYTVTSYELLKNDDKPLFLHLKHCWKYTIEYCTFRNVYKESLIGKAVNIEPFIQDKALLERAKEIEEKLQRYLPAGRKLTPSVEYELSHQSQ